MKMPFRTSPSVIRIFPVSPWLVFLVALFSLPIVLSAQILLIDPGNSSGTASLSGSSPYSVGTATWNQGAANNYPASLLYSDGSTATGITIVADSSLLTSGNSTLNFDTSPSVSQLAGNSTGAIYSADPSRSSIYGGFANVNASVVGMRIDGLSNGLYEIYVAAAYLGGNSSDRPGGSTPAQLSVWGFGGTSVSTLDYASGLITGAGFTSLARNELLENTSASSWLADDNYVKIQIQITESLPSLYIVSSGYTDNTTSEELRGWLNLVQVVAIPEPASGSMAGAGLGCLYLLRRVKRRFEARALKTFARQIG